MLVSIHNFNNLWTKSSHVWLLWFVTTKLKVNENSCTSNHLFTFYKNITLIKVAYFPFKYGTRSTTNIVSLHQSPSTTGADMSGECTHMHVQHGISKTYLFQFFGRKVSSREVFFNTWTWKSTTWTLMNCNSQLNVYIHACVCLAVKLIRSVKRVKRVIGTWVCQVTELIKMFLPFPHIPMKTFCQGIKPVRDLVLCTYWRHWIDGRRYTKAVKRKSTFFANRQ